MTGQRDTAAATARAGQRSNAVQSVVGWIAVRRLASRVGAWEKEPGIRWTVAGAHAIANVRAVLFTHQWDDDDLVVCPR